MDKHEQPKPEVLGDFLENLRELTLRAAEQTLLCLEEEQRSLEEAQRKSAALDPLRSFINREIGDMLAEITSVAATGEEYPSAFRFVSNIEEADGCIVYLLCFTDAETEEPWLVENGIYKPVVIEVDPDQGISVSNYLAETRIRIPHHPRGGEMLRRFIIDWACSVAPDCAEDLDSRIQMPETAHPHVPKFLR